jgi:hypothetical protein
MSWGKIYNSTNFGRAENIQYSIINKSSLMATFVNYVIRIKPNALENIECVRNYLKDLDL